MSLHMQAQIRHIQFIYCVICEPGGTLGGSHEHNNLQLTLSRSLTHTLPTAVEHCCCGICATAADCAAANCAAATS